MQTPKLLCDILCLFPAVAEVPEADRASILKSMDNRVARYNQLSKQIWNYAELGFAETQSAATLEKELAGAGFKIQVNVGGAPTAFTATWGSGKPVIAILGEYD